MSEMRKSVIPGYTGFVPTQDILKYRPYQEIEKSSNHIPGYRGYVSGVKAENVFAKTFGRSSKESISGSIARGHDLKDQERYYSTNNLTYVNQRNLHQEQKETNPFLQPRKVSLLGNSGMK
jgi:hypothetical protein